MTTSTAVPVTSDVAAPPYADWWRRVVAALLDSAVLGAVTWFAVGDLATAPSLQPTFGVAGTQERQSWTTSAVLVGAWLAMLVLQGLTGQTPGRRVLGIEVVRAPVGGPVGGRPGVLRSVARYCAHLLDAIALIGYLRPIFHHERRTFADSMVGTVVLRRPPSGRDGRAVAVTVLAWVVVMVGLACGVTVGESGGTTRHAETVCPVGLQDPDAPVRVEDVRLVRETEWRRAERLFPWVAGMRPTERTYLAVELTWDVTGSTNVDSALQVTATGGAALDADVSVGDGWASLPADGGTPGPVDVTVRVDGRAVMSCVAPPFVG